MDIARSTWLAAVVPVLTVAHYGAGIPARWVWPAFPAIALLHLLAIVLPDGRTIRERIADDAWTSLIVALLVLSLIALELLPGGADLRASRLLVGGAMMLVSARILTVRSGSALTERLPLWAILPVSFGCIIAAGTALLLLPMSTHGGIRLLDALFTSTSAVCVTGLVVVDTGTFFTTFGQAVILLLIQVGGLGLMSFFAFFALFLGHGVGIVQSVTLSKAVDAQFLSDLKRTIASVIGWTFTIEAVGAILLYTSMQPARVGAGSARLAWEAVFHSISAFCNAGFSLFPDNLEQFANNPSVCLTVSFLIIAGGLGFVVLTGLAGWMIARLRGSGGYRLDVHSRLVLLVSGVLLVGGMILFALLEWDNTLSGMGFLSRLSNSFLEAATPRTAGFNTVPTASLGAATRWLFVILMFIGASPGGTGGGVKTTTVGLLAASALSLLHKRPQPEMWRRMIPLADLQRAAVICFASIVLVVVSGGLLLLSESAAIRPWGFAADDYVFETFSAFGTVGLSTGVTPHLTTAGRWIIIFTMFLGRVGISALAALIVRSRILPYRYPVGRIGMG